MTQSDLQFIMTPNIFKIVYLMSLFLLVNSVIESTLDYASIIHRYR